MSLIHASCVAFGRHGVLIRGKSGSGKSSLCLRLMDGEGFGFLAQPLRAQLVADDQVVLSVINGQLIATPPAALAGKMEIRGLGIVNVPNKSDVPLVLVVDLLPVSEIERMPQVGELQTKLEGIVLPRLALDAADVSAPAKLRAALGHFGLV